MTQKSQLLCFLISKLNFTKQKSLALLRGIFFEEYEIHWNLSLQKLNFNWKITFSISPFPPFYYKHPGYFTFDF